MSHSPSPGSPGAAASEGPAAAPHAPQENAQAHAVDDRVLLRWVWHSYIRRRVPMLTLAMVIAALEGASAGVLSLSMRPLLDDALIGGDGEALFLVGTVLAAVFVFRGLARIAAAAITAHVAEREAARLQSDVLGHILKLDIAFYQQNAPGGLIERVRGDGEAMSSLFNQVLPFLARDVIAVVVLLGVAFYTDWVWTLIVIVASPLVVLPIYFMQRFVRRVTRRERVAAAETSRQLDEIFHGIVTLKLIGAEPRALARFGAVLLRFAHARVMSMIGRSTIPSLIDMIAAVGIFAVLIYGGRQIIDGERTVGQLVSFIIAFGLLFDPLRSLGDIAGRWQAILASLERLWRLFDTQPTIRPPAPPFAPVPARDACRIVFDDVSFSYDRLPAVSNLSFVIEPGEKVAVMGRSGAGKSTLFLLLTRLVDPESGRITIGGQDIARMELPALRSLFSVVTQETALFDGTLRENVLMGNPQADNTALDAACRVARVSDFLPDLKDGADTLVGPRGSRLSGGQRQRVTIARAVLRDAPVLLLDEPTSALDSNSEALVNDALRALRGTRTMIIITHRMTTAAAADRILVLDRGRLLAQGSHAELVADETHRAYLATDRDG